MASNGGTERHNHLTRDIKAPGGCPKCDLYWRNHWLHELYTEEGVAVWIADAEKKGLSLDEQITRLAQLVDGAYA